VYVTPPPPAEFPDPQAWRLITHDD
jgi:hypothetical protein